MRAWLALLTAVWLLAGAAAAEPPGGPGSEEGVAAESAPGPAAAPAGPARLTPHQRLLLARVPLLLKLRMLEARRRDFKVASDPAEGERLEREIKAVFAQVVDLYQRYLKEHPRDARAYYELGTLYYWEGQDEDRAASLWLRTIELDPRFDLAYNALAVHYADAAAPDKALRFITEALRLEPDQPVYHFNAATFLFSFRQQAMKMFGWDLRRTWREILGHYREALRLDPDNYVFARDYAQTFNFAHYFGVEADYRRARAVWEQALPLAPSRSERVMVLTNLARVSLYLGERAAAERYLREALRLNPHNPVALLLRRRMAEGKPVRPVSEILRPRRALRPPPP